MSDVVIRVDAVRRVFEDVEAVRGISFEVGRGKVVGFIGANGAGKTTTMRMMVTLDQPSAGRIEIAGWDVVGYPSRIRERVGWMPDSYGAYKNVTVFEYLDFMARAFGFKSAERKARVEEVMAFTDLAAIRDRNMDSLSKGMGQRLCLGRALLNDPEVLILDEPAAGLDPRARSEFKELVRLLADEGKTIFISSHILSELAEMCDLLLFIDAGKLVHYGPPESLTRTAEGAITVHVEVLGDVERLLQWIELDPEAKLVETRKKGASIRIDSIEDEVVGRVLKRMIDAGLIVTEFRKEETRLEEAFIEILRKVQGGQA
jgi:ABC-2 type transport system ATP-binding protein